MNKKKVEFEFNPMRLIAAIGTVLAVVTAGYAMASWIDDAEESHRRADMAPPPPYYEALEEEQDDTNTTLDLLKENQLQLQQQEILRQELWGPNYRKKISEILDEEDENPSNG